MLFSPALASSAVSAVMMLQCFTLQHSAAIHPRQHLSFAYTHYVSFWLPLHWSKIEVRLFKITFKIIKETLKVSNYCHYVYGVITMIFFKTVLSTTSDFVYYLTNQDGSYSWRWLIEYVMKNNSKILLSSKLTGC